MQNFAARILTNTRKYDSISPILHELGWLTVQELLRLRDITLIGLTSRYLSSKLTERLETHLSIKVEMEINLPFPNVGQ